MPSRTANDPRAGNQPGAQNHQLLTFMLDDQPYALAIGNVVQVVRMVAITRAPKAPEYVEGMINLRGKVIPVINLRKRFGLSAKPLDLDNHLLIAETEDRTMALIVDVVSEVVTLSDSNLDYPSEFDSESTEYLKAVGKMGDRLLLILDLNKALSSEEQRRLQRAFAFDAVQVKAAN